jgi:hypothetical protein
MFVHGARHGEELMQSTISVFYVSYPYVCIGTAGLTFGFTDQHEGIKDTSQERAIRLADIPIPRLMCPKAVDFKGYQL